MIYFDTPYLAVHWDDVTKCVIMEWKKHARSHEFRTGLDKGLELIRKKASHRWLADMRNMGALAKSDQDWSNEDWFPRALAGGISRMALIVPKSVLSQMAVEAIMSKVEGTNLETAYFDDIKKAKDWLRS